MTSLNEDRNLLGRLIAAAVLVGAVAGVHRISCGAASCPFLAARCCAFSGKTTEPQAAPAAAPAAPAARTAKPSSDDE